MAFCFYNQIHPEWYFNTEMYYFTKIKRIAKYIIIIIFIKMLNCSYLLWLLDIKNSLAVELYAWSIKYLCFLFDSVLILSHIIITNWEETIK